MKIIIAGTRSIPIAVAFSYIERAFEQTGWHPPEMIVSGNSGGVDLAGEAYARRHGIPLRTFPANWEAYGRSAGPRRNAEMAEFADALIAIRDGQQRSNGTVNMIGCMNRLGKAVHEMVL